MKIRTAAFVRLCNRPIPRVLRMMLAAEALGLDPIFVGAFRDKGLASRDCWDDWEVVRIGPYFPLVNGTRPFLYLWSVLRFGFSTLKYLFKTKPDLVHASEFEAFWACRAYGWLSGKPVIFNIHDNLGQRYTCPAWVAAVLNFAEGLAATAATTTTVPEDFRRRALPSWCQHNVLVVKNAPVDPGYREITSRPSDMVRLFYGGWIDAGRGIRPLTGLVTQSPTTQLRLAGEGGEDLVSHIRAQPGVTFLGYLNHKAVIEETASCDFVAAFYDPSRPINRFAASNKIAETLAVGRPLLVNAEQEIVGLLEEYGCAVVVPYETVSSIGPLLSDLRADEPRYAEMCRQARRAYEDHYAWPLVWTSMMKLYSAAGIVSEHQTFPSPPSAS
jgi:glycosyltransferase involved in cell wall biosynthesis